MMNQEFNNRLKIIKEKLYKKNKQELVNRVKKEKKDYIMQKIEFKENYKDDNDKDNIKRLNNSNKEKNSFIEGSFWILKKIVDDFESIRDKSFRDILEIKSELRISSIEDSFLQKFKLRFDNFSKKLTKYFSFINKQKQNNLKDNKNIKESDLNRNQRYINGVSQSNLDSESSCFISEIFIQ